MNDTPDFFQDHRLAKRDHLLASGVNPYPYSFRPTHTVDDLIRDFETLSAETAGVSAAERLLSARKMGKSWFIDLYDRGEKFQLYVRKDEADDQSVALVVVLDWRLAGRDRNALPTRWRADPAGIADLRGISWPMCRFGIILDRRTSTPSQACVRA